MLYERKIRYVDYYEDGERARGGGFLKAEIRDGGMRIELHIRGLYPTDTFARDVVLKGAGTEAVLGQITLLEGKGYFEYACDIGRGIGDTGISYDELRELRVPVGGRRELRCAWKSAGSKAPDKAPDKAPAEEAAPMETVAAQARLEDVPSPSEMQSLQAAGAEEKGDGGEVNGGRETVRNLEMSCAEAYQPFEEGEPGMELQERPRQERKTSREEGRPQGDRQVKKKAVKLLENKWQQISAIYPHISPFHDEREYLSLSPSDFVLFPEIFYKAANNSFLLHGYYNYEHLILARVECRGEARYYLGVPGNYYEREKQVAVMFGFESFECAREPAGTGDFGYYMMRVEI